MEIHQKKAEHDLSQVEDDSEKKYRTEFECEEL